MGEPIATVGDLAGICGHDGTNWEKVLIDASKRLVVVVEDTAGHETYIHGYDGSNWRKLGLVWGYYDRWAENITHTTTAGQNLIDVTAVPEGYVYVLRFWSLYHNDAAARSGNIRMRTSTADASLIYPTTNFAPQTWYTEALDTPMKEDDYVRAIINGMLADKTVYFRVWGYMMKVNM